MLEYDYIIVGAGSAGCALAARLSEVPSQSVCVLEAGGKDDSVLVEAPLGFAVMLPFGLMNSWHYFTVPQPGLGGRKGLQPRGKVLGGSSSVNAMVYTRGNRLDYDGWAAQGNPGWSYDDLLPVFKRAEHNHCVGENDYRGVNGPLHVSYLRSPSPANEGFMAACVEQGIDRNPDYNGAQQWGVGPTQATQYNGERWSAARAYLHCNAGRSNLKVRPRVHVHRVLFEARRAVGVLVEIDGQLQTLKARKEVILSAGAYGSPQLLMCSGVGPGAHLQAHGIEVVHDLPGVGENLCDHITSNLIYRSKRWRDSIAPFHWGGSLALLSAVMEWARARTGWLTTSVVEVQGFFSTCGNNAHPDIQIAFIPGFVDEHSRKPHWGAGLTLHVTLARPKSRGSVRLASANPKEAPLIDPGFFQHPDDMRTLLKGVQKGLAILESPAMAPWRGKPLYRMDGHDPEGLEAFLRKTCDTEYHPTGTCKMGPDHDEGAVVDAQLRVKGVQGLRVVDASIMPTIITGNTNAASMVIGERAADFMRESKPAVSI